MPTRNQFVLHENHPRALDDASGAKLRALSGIVWITETGLAQDVFLRAGEDHQLRRKGRVVVEALRGDARIELCRGGWRLWVEHLGRISRNATAIATPPSLASSPAPTAKSR